MKRNVHTDGLVVGCDEGIKLDFTHGEFLGYTIRYRNGIKLFILGGTGFNSSYLSLDGSKYVKLER